MLHVSSLPNKTFFLDITWIHLGCLNAWNTVQEVAIFVAKTGGRYKGYPYLYIIIVRASLPKWIFLNKVRNIL